MQKAKTAQAVSNASRSTRSRKTQSSTRSNIRARSTSISSTPSRRGACSTGSSATNSRRFLWRKIRYGLSAGRVQSVAVRLVVERERLIQAFNKEEYWTIEAIFLPPKGKAKQRPSPPRFNSINGKAIGKMGIKNEHDAKNIIEGLNGAKYHIADITVKEVRRNPSAPFTTSTLQQEAARKLGFRAKQTMMVAQQLYENGHITYMRTDSVNLAESALATGARSDRHRIRQRISARRTAPLFDEEQRRAGSARSDPPDEP